MRLGFVYSALVFALAMLPCRTLALEGVDPGKRLCTIPVMASRQQAVKAAQRQFGPMKAKHHVSHDANGYVEDVWVVPFDSDHSDIFIVLSRNGKVRQLSLRTSLAQGQTNLSFGQLAKRHNLKEHSYGFDDPQGGGYVGFYYDDIDHGVCFTLGVQDSFLLTMRPDTIIVHAPGMTALPYEDGICGKIDKGSETKVFKNQADADHFEQHQRNDY